MIPRAFGTGRHDLVTLLSGSGPSLGRPAGSIRVLGFINPNASVTLPTVLRSAGLRVIIRFGPREHGPPHVHVYSGDGECELRIEHESVQVKAVHNMADRDVRSAHRLVEENLKFLLREWRRLHAHTNP